MAFPWFSFALLLKWVAKKGLSIAMLRAALERFLTDDFAKGFDENHYAVFPADAVPPAVSERYLADIKHCFTNVAKIPNEVEFLLPTGPVKLTKPNVFECDMFNDAHRNQLPCFKELFETELPQLAELFRERFETASDLSPIHGTDDSKRNTTVKLQMNCGGSFPWHYDNPSKPNKRRLTMAVYLTPDWEEGCGGELLLLPFLKPMIEVRPKMCTVALFRSDSMLHAVRPIDPSRNVTRYCFTVWFDGMCTNSDDDLNLKAKHLKLDALAELQRSPVQRVLSRCVYDEEYREGLVACFGVGTKDTALSLALHDAHLKPLLANAAVMSFVEKLKELKPKAHVNKDIAD